MIAKSDLRHWSDSMDTDISIFDAYLFAKTGKLHVPGSAPAAFLAGENASLKKEVEAAVETFATTGDWPKALSHDAYLHLFYRAFNAHGILAAASCMEEGAPGLIDQCLPRFAPDPADKPRFIRWLYIDNWDERSEAFIKAISENRMRFKWPLENDRDSADS